VDVIPAVAIAKKYTKPKDDNYSLIRFEPGAITAQTDETGVIVACEAVTFTCAVDAVQLTAMLKKAGTGATMRLDRDQLVITGTGGVFELRVLRDGKKLPAPPESPRRFVELDERTFKLLVSVAGLALTSGDDAALSAVRIAPSWAAASRGNALAVGWFVDAAGASLDIVKEPATVSAKFFAGLRGAVGLGMSKAFFWLAQGDIRRWTRRLDVGWPDSAVSGDNLAKLRAGGVDRAVLTLDTSATRALFDRALAAADSNADPYRLTWGEQLALSGGGLTGRFSGAVDAAADGKGKTFGVAPATWLCCLDALLSACDDPVYLSLAGPTDPAALWSLDPRALEVFIWPEYLPTP